jgi:hypothetical protein
MFCGAAAPSDPSPLKPIDVTCGISFRRSAVVTAPDCLTSSTPIWMRLEPTGATPRMRLPVTTTFIVSASAGASLEAAAGCSCAPAIDTDEATSIASDET